MISQYINEVHVQRVSYLAKSLVPYALCRAPMLYPLPLGVNVHDTSDTTLIRYWLHLDLVCSTRRRCLVENLVVARVHFAAVTLFLGLVRSRTLVMCRLLILPQQQEHEWGQGRGARADDDNGNSDAVE